MKPYYDDGKGIQIYHGDCRVILSEMSLLQITQLDAIVTDPPYGINLENHAQGGNHGRRRASDYAIKGDENTAAGDWIVDWACQFNRPIAVFASPKKPWRGEFRNYLVWNKGGAVGGGGDVVKCWKQSWELIQIARNENLIGTRDEAVLEFPVMPSASILHPAQKPIELMKYLLRKLLPLPSTVCDPFMGSGSTLRAAKDLGLYAIGIELEEKYCEIAAKRLQQEVFDFGVSA